MTMFNDKHEYLSFKDISEREEYWIGRLVKAKIAIKINLFDEIPMDTLGLVLQISDNNWGEYMLIVKWMTGQQEVCYQYDVFSHNENTFFNPKKKVTKNT